MKSFLGVGLAGLWLVGAQAAGAANEKAAGAPPEAAKPATAPPAAPVRDYTGTFEKLYKLGLPDVKGAAYVQLASGGDPVGSLMQMMEHAATEGSASRSGEETKPLRLTGNAYQLPSPPDTPAWEGRFVHDGGSMQTVVNPEKLGKDVQSRREATEKIGAQNKEFGTWKPADLAKDAHAILARLAEIRKKADSTQTEIGFKEQPQIPGKLFLEAALWSRMGLTDEANQLASQMVDLSGNPKALMATVVEMLADAQYDYAMDRFLDSSGDWPRFKQDLDALLARFGGGVWKKAPAVKLLADRVGARLQQTAIPPLTTPGLTDEDRALAAAWLTDTPPPRFDVDMMGNCSWLLSGKEELSFMFGGASGTDSALFKLLNRGPSAVPLLIALANDEALTRIPSEGRGSGIMSWDQDDAPADPGKQALAMYRNLRRPLTRGEIACAMLRGILPERERNEMDRNTDPEELVREAQAWLAENRGKSRLDLARAVLMRSGEENSETVDALQLLIKEGTDADFAMVENLLLKLAGAEDSPMSDGALAIAYVRVRGGKAKDFVEKLAAVFATKKRSGETGEDKEMREQVEHRQQATLALLRTMAAARPAEVILADLKTETSQDSPKWRELVLSLDNGGPRRAIELLTPAAAAQELPENRCQLLILLAREYEIARNSVDGEGGKTAPGTEVDFRKHADLWKTMLADTRPLPVSNQPWATTSCDTCGDFAALMLERIALRSRRGNPAGGGATNLIFLSASRVNAAIRRRAEAALAGTELPAYPAAEDVPEARVAALVKQAADMPPGALAEWVASLPDGERMAFCGAADKSRDLDAKLAPLAHRITQVRVQPGNPELEKALGALAGGKLDLAAFTLLLEQVRGQAAAGRFVAVEAARIPGLVDGVRLTARVTRLEPAPEGRAAAAPGRIMASLAAGDIHATASWPLADTAARPQAAAATAQAAGPLLADRLIANMRAEIAARRAAGAEKELLSFRTAVQDMAAGKGGACGPAVLSLRAVAPGAVPGTAPAEMPADGDSEVSFDEL